MKKNESQQSVPPAAFYSVADSKHFLGVIGLLNSVRVLGHNEPVFILDCGFTAEQRALIEPHAVVVKGPLGVHPTLLKMRLPRAYPADVMVLLDADVIVVRALDELINQARYGRFVTFLNDRDRHRPEWGHLLALGAIPRRPYINAGHFLVPRVLSNDVFDACDRALLQMSIPRNGPPRTSSPADPLWIPDQDILNAVLAAKIPESKITVLNSAGFTPFEGIRADSHSLRCVRADGEPLYLLHHILEKPWLSALPDCVYSLLLRRLLNSEDVAVRVPSHLIPLRFRTGRLARADQVRASVQAVVRRYTRGRLGIRPHLQGILREMQSLWHGGDRI